LLQQGGQQARNDWALLSPLPRRIAEQRGHFSNPTFNWLVKGRAGFGTCVGLDEVPYHAS